VLIELFDLLWKAVQGQKPLLMYRRFHNCIIYSGRIDNLYSPDKVHPLANNENKNIKN